MAPSPKIARRSLLAAGALCLPLPAAAKLFNISARAQGAGFSPDGSTVVGGSSGGTLVTRYGTWSMGEIVAPHDGSSLNAFYRVMLNGVDCLGLLAVQVLRVDHGGNLYGCSFDQIWYYWENYSWQGNDGADFASGPATTPAPPNSGPSSFTPPYTPSADGTAIAGPAGSVTTADGIWTFGGSNWSGSGWDLTLNGLPVDAAFVNQGFPVGVTHLEVNSSGRLFFQKSDGNWRVWSGNSSTASTASAPTSSPIPIGITFSPSNPALNASDPVGTTISVASVVMSNGSTFSGVLTAGLDSFGGTQVVQTPIVANTLKTNYTPLPVAIPSVNPITATQNGVAYTTIIDAQIH